METKSLKELQAAYAPYRQNKLKSGLFYQDFVVDACWHSLKLAIVPFSSKEYQQRVGESLTGAEIKLDENYARTGNLYIEVAEKAQPRNGDYYPSGICRADNAWLYLIGDFDTIFVFGKRLLRHLHNSGKYRVFEIPTKTSKGFLLSGAKHEPEKYAEKVLTPAMSNQILKIRSDIKEDILRGKELLAILQTDARQTVLPFSDVP
jgi:hypothetical protein